MEYGVKVPTVRIYNSRLLRVEIGVRDKLGKAEIQYQLCAPLTSSRVAQGRILRRCDIYL